MNDFLSAREQQSCIYCINSNSLRKSSNLSIQSLNTSIFSPVENCRFGYFNSMVKTVKKHCYLNRTTHFKVVDIHVVLFFFGGVQATQPIEQKKHAILHCMYHMPYTPKLVNTLTSNAFQTNLSPPVSFSPTQQCTTIFLLLYPF